LFDLGLAAFLYIFKIIFFYFFFVFFGFYSFLFAVFFGGQFNGLLCFFSGNLK